MNKKRLIILIWFFFACISTWYLLQLRDWISLFNEGAAPHWFKDLAIRLYPRLDSELNRINPITLVKYGDQLILRSFLCLSATSVLLVLFEKKSTQRHWNIFWENCSHNQLLNRLFFLFVLLLTWDWWKSIPLIVQAKAFYKPISFLTLFGETFPSELVLKTFYIVFVICLIVYILKPQWHFLPLTGMVLLIILQTWFVSFEKMDHGLTTVFYVGLPLAGAIAFNKSYLIQLSRVLLVTTYLFAGLEKLLISGMHWMDGYALHVYLRMHASPAGLWLSEHSTLCILLSFATILFQLSFWMILVFPKYRWVFIFLAVSFHLGTVIFFSISSFFNPWLIPLIVLLPGYDKSGQQKAATLATR